MKTMILVVLAALIAVVSYRAGASDSEGDLRAFRRLSSCTGQIEVDLDGGAYRQPGVWCMRGRSWEQVIALPRGSR